MVPGAGVEPARCFHRGILRTSGIVKLLILLALQAAIWCLYRYAGAFSGATVFSICLSAFEVCRYARK
jgi:hypothetical protein